MMCKKVRLAFVIFLFVCFALLITGCSGNVDQAIENVVGELIDEENKNIEAERGEDVSEDVNDDKQQGGEESAQSPNDSAEDPADGGNKTEWPSEIPGYVPQLQGDIDAVVKMHPEEDATSYTIAYENVNDVGMDYYENELVSNGWAIDQKTNFGESWMIQANYNNEAAIIISTENEEKSGMIILTLLQ